MSMRETLNSPVNLLNILWLCPASSMLLLSLSYGTVSFSLQDYDQTLGSTGTMVLASSFCLAVTTDRLFVNCELAETRIT